MILVWVLGFLLLLGFGNFGTVIVLLLLLDFGMFMNS